MHMGLETWVNEFGEWLPRKLDACQGVHCIHHYAQWVKYDQHFKPRLSKHFLDDGDMARKFLNAVRFFGIGDRAKECFPKYHLERVFGDVTRYLLNEGEDRLCGVWMGCAVNVGVENRPIQTRMHRDVQGFLY